MRFQMKRLRLPAVAFIGAMAAVVAPSPSRAAGHSPDVTLRCRNTFIEGRPVKPPEFNVRIWFRPGLVEYGSAVPVEAKIGEDSITFSVAEHVSIIIDRKFGHFFSINVGNPHFPKTEEGKCSLIPKNVF
jgi:hypothetical protein